MTTHLDLDKRATGLLWLLVRLMLGAYWLSAGLGKLTDPGGAWVGGAAGSAVARFLNDALTKAAGPRPQVQTWYAVFIHDIALPNAATFSYLVTFGETLVGLALIFGLLTRFAAFCGLLMNLAYVFAGAASTNPQAILLELPIVVLGTSAGYYGLDRFLEPLVQRSRVASGAGQALRARLGAFKLAALFAGIAAIGFSVLPRQYWLTVTVLAIGISLLVPLAVLARRRPAGSRPATPMQVRATHLVLAAVALFALTLIVLIAL
jgi:thiosulfate dehydrogenase [quinone] large subunit